MRVYIVDDDPRICRTLARMVSCEGFETRIFEGPAAFLKAFHTLDYGCVMLDIGMPGHNGLDVLEEILRRHPPWPVVMASGSTAVDDAISSFRRGAIHFLRKPFRRDDLRCALQEAATVGAARLAGYQRQTRAQQIRLTERERQVLAAMAEGLQSKVIAWQFGLSIRTVDMHRSNILTKLSASNSSQAVSIARSLDLLAPSHAAA